MMPRNTRNLFSLGVICLFTFICIYLYRTIDTSAIASTSLQQEKKIAELKLKIDGLHSILRSNRDEIEALKLQLEEVERKRKQERDKQIEKENEVYDEKAKAEKALEEKVVQIAGDANHKAVEEEQRGVIPEPNRGNKIAVVHEALQKRTTQSLASLPVCQLRNNYTNAQADVQMLDLYNVIDFANVDGGAWRQGWEVTYDQEKVAEQKTLEVFVIPHSHCDPGWIKTFEEYYQSQTKHILDGMASHLGDEKKEMRFIYAEISFFELWWRDQNDDVKKKVKQLLKSGQFEIVTGGWVMTDEANAHYFSIIAELIEGHEWMRNHLGPEFVPTTHWSIDPFGLSPTLPYLLSAANITNAAIQRVHYSVKKHLARKKQLEFMWRQLWGSHGKNDVRTHMFPFYSYDVPHTCGPDPKVCCQFDFKRLPGGSISCPWNVPAQVITEVNVAERAFTLYDQYRKKSQLYQTNVLLVPLGDDFRYADDFEWNGQYKNYVKLFEEMNKRKEWNVHAQFGTLSDYFAALDRSLRASQQPLPVLSGDFFTYADRDDHYWSGYFTSRPFYKQMDRTLQHQLRAAEIAFSLHAMKGEPVSSEVFAELVQARRALSLFQHHDGVTGTAKAYVMDDYGKKMLEALQGTERVLSEAISDLLNAESVSTTNLELDESRKGQHSLPTRLSYRVGQFVVLFNTLSRSRDEPVCIHVSSRDAAVKALDGKEVQQQLSPVIELRDNHLVASDVFELCFVAHQGPFGMSVYEVVASAANQKPSLATISAKASVEISGFKFEPITRADSFSLKNSQLEATFSGLSGFLQAVTPSGHSKVDVNVQFVHYGARPKGKINNKGGDNLSGAYLFLPDAEAKELPADEQEFMVVSGPIMKRVYVVGPKNLKILQVYSLAEGAPSVEIVNEVDIRASSNFELAMRMNTNVQSGDDLYTDLNGMQIIRRRRQLDKLPIQAHFYPMPSAAYIEDTSTRLSLLGAQPLGVASLKAGQLEVMLDRRLDQDDGRGLEEDVHDNLRTLSRFRLLVEPLKPLESKATVEERVGFLSLVGLAQSMELYYPTVRMVSSAKMKTASASGMASSLSCDVHVVNLRTLAGPTDYNGSGKATPRDEAAFVLYRPLTDCRSKLQLRSDCDQQGNTIAPLKLFPSISSVREASLTLLYEHRETAQFTMEPQDVTTVKLSW